MMHGRVFRHLFAAVTLVLSAAPLPGASESQRIAGGSATRYENNRVLIRWRVAPAVDILGFHVYREVNGEKTRITPGLIAGPALLTGTATGLTAERSFAWWDESPSRRSGAWYWIEELTVSGESAWHGPIQAVPAGDGQRGIEASTPSRLLSELGRMSLPGSFRPDSGARAELTASRLKIQIAEEGWYRLTREEMEAAGFRGGDDPALLQLFLDGSEQAMHVVTGDSGALEAVEFYATGAENAVTALRTYWLSAGSAPGKRVVVEESPGTGLPGASFPFTVEWRDKLVYFSSLRNGEAENFFGQPVTSKPLDQTVMVMDPAPDRLEAILQVSVQGVYSGNHSIDVRLNGQSVGVLRFWGQFLGTASLKVDGQMLRAGENTVTLQAKGGELDISLVDFVRLTYPRLYRAENGALRFSAPAGQPVTAGGFSTRGIRVIDITGAAYGDVREVQGTISAENPEGTLWNAGFTPVGGGSRTLLALTPDRIKKPVSIMARPELSLRDRSNAADMVVITRREFIDSLAPLKALREGQGLTVAIVDVEDIYDEFSYGQISPQAIKSFLSFASKSWQTAPRFLLFFGDASLDPKNYLGFGDFNLVPTKLIDTALMETASDDWFVTSSGDSLPALAVGRLPVRTREEADRAIARIVSYEDSPAAPSVLLVSGANQDYDFESENAQLRGLIPESLQVAEIRRGGMTAEEAKQALEEGLSRGQKLVNYAGHGSVDIWSGNLLSSDDAKALTNDGHLPFFVMMTCLNGYFQEPSIDSLGKALVKAEHGGAIAVWASTGLTTPEGQSPMNRQMFKLIFPDGDQPLTLGEATSRAKAATNDIDVRRTWVLLGDPAMRLK